MGNMSTEEFERIWVDPFMPQGDGRAEQMAANRRALPKPPWYASGKHGATKPTRPMSPEKFAETMQACRDIGDQEARHGDADDLLCEVLRSLGYDKGIDIFNAMDKWYA